MATQAPDQPELTAPADGNGLAPEGRRGRRGVVYALLKAAGERGITRREFAEAGIPMSPVHLESLRYEGHGIQQLVGRTETGDRTDRYILTTDAWAGG